MLTTDEYWTVKVHANEDDLAAGITYTAYDLNTYAYNIVTIAGVEGIPPQVGENFVRVGRHGRRWRPKLADQRTITLGMWVRGATVDNNSVNQDQRAQFRTNWEVLKSLFGSAPDRQLELTRRIELVDGLHVRTALGEVANTMELSPQGPAAASFTVDLTLAFPYWAEAQQSSLTHLPGSSWSVTNTGVACWPRVVFNGPMGKPTITSSTYGNSISFGAMDIPQLGSGDQLVVDFDERTVLYYAAGSGGPVNRYYWMDRGSDWFQLRTGVNQLQASSTTPISGSVDVYWVPIFS